MSIMKKIYYCLCDDKLYGSYYASVELYGFLIDFYKCTKKYPNVKNRSNKGVEDVISFIEKEYAKKITLETLFEISGLSEGYLCRLFKQYFDMRPLEYLNKKRIQQSMKLLAISHMSVEAISEKVGFGSPSYYTKIFKKSEGMTPSEYRTMLLIGNYGKPTPY